MRFIVLGSAAGGGFPQWNCNCANCRRARSGDRAATARTQSSLAVSVDGERWLLLNASPDLRQQIGATPALHPVEGLRDSPIAAVVITNADVDHIGGLINLRESQPLALYANDRILEVLDANPIFGVLNPEFVERRSIGIGRKTEILDGLAIEIFPVPGKVALFLEKEGEGANFGTVEGDTVAVRLIDERRGVEAFYVPNCAAMTPALAERLAGARLVFFDGTLYRDDEMIAAGLGRKTGGRMGHISVDGPAGAIVAFETLDVGRKVFVHINNSNPMLMTDSPERARVEAEGWEVAFDGMELEI